MVPFLLLVALALLPGIAHGVTIYRFGGEDLPRPPEVGQPGVVFRQLPWTRLGETGSQIRIRADRAIAPFQHTRFTPLPLLDFNKPRLAVLFDRYEEGCKRDVFLSDRRVPLRRPLSVPGCVRPAGYHQHLAG